MKLPMAVARAVWPILVSRAAAASNHRPFNPRVTHQRVGLASAVI